MHLSTEDSYRESDDESLIMFLIEGMGGLRMLKLRVSN